MEMGVYFVTYLTAINAVQTIRVECAKMDSKFILYNLQLVSVKNAIRAMLIIA